MEKGLQSAVDAITEAFDEIVAIIKRVVRALSDAIHSVLKKINPRVYHLAYHGVTSRIRKKNMKRLWGCLLA